MLSDAELLDGVKKILELPSEKRELIKLAMRSSFVRDMEFGAEGFSHWYWCLTRHELPPYTKNIWIPALCNAKMNRTGVIIEGFRGATKSTIVFSWILYIQGKFPTGSTILVRINDAAAAETGNAMADVIQKSVAWKLCFPDVVPDTDRKWSTEGWFIKDKKVAYADWIQKTLSDHLGEPSILTAGITSGIHIGKHPSNGWYFDDFHDEQNTRSVREMRGIVETIEKNIVPTWTRPEGHPTLAGACTFWDEEDGYHSLLKTGLFQHIKTPIFESDPTSEIIYRGVSHRDEHVRLAWPEAFPVERIMEIENQNPVWFPVMYLCDLGALKGTVLKKEWLHEYPADKIGDSWPVYIGVDFASSDDKLTQNKRDYFAMAVCKAIPGGGVVIVDGLRGKFPSSDSMGHIKAFASKYPSLVTVGVEKWGKGETFKDMLLYNTRLPVVALPFGGSPTKSKGQRFQAEGGLAPMFVDGRLWLASDLNDDFRKSFTDEWIGWDGSASRTGNDDCLDAVYWTAYAAQGHLIPTAERNREDRRKKNKEPSPWKALTNLY